MIPPSPLGEPWPLWAYVKHSDRLHVVTSLERIDDEWWSSGRGKTLCGRRGFLINPGILTRLGMPRCHHCCRMLDIPPGIGHPKNDPNLRPLFGYGAPKSEDNP